MRAIKRNAPCLLFDTRLTAQCAVTVAARCITVHCVHILGPVSTADSGLAPHSPSDYQCPISDIPTFIKALCV